MIVSHVSLADVERLLDSGRIRRGGRGHDQIQRVGRLQLGVRRRTRLQDDIQVRGIFINCH